MRGILLTTAAALLIATPMAFAQDTDTSRDAGDGGFNPAADFSELDGNEDGMVSRDEFMSNESMDEETFSEIDTDGDDMISEEEMSAYDATDLNHSTNPALEND